MKRVRIVFKSEIFIEGKTLNKIIEKFENMPLFSPDAEKCDVDFVDIVSIEDMDS